MLTQLWIAITGVVAVALLQFGSERARAAAPFVGLAGQPAWIAHAIDSNALGVSVVVGLYTLLWMAGCAAVWKRRGERA